MNTNPTPCESGTRQTPYLSWFNQWLGCPGVGPDDIAVLVALARFCNEAGECWPSQGTLADLLGRSRPWINAVIRHLVALGAIEKHQRGTSSCMYRLRPPPTAPSCPPEDGGPDNDRTEAEASVSPSDITSADPPPCPTADTGRHPADSGRHAADTNFPKSYDSLSPPAREREPEPTIGLTWRPTPDDIAWARVHAPTLDLERFTERFVLRCTAKGYRYRDPSAAWRSWILDDLKVPSDAAASASRAHAGTHRARNTGSGPSGTRRRGPCVPAGADLAARNAATASAVLQRLARLDAGRVPAGCP